MVRASTSAASAADKVKVGTVRAEETTATVAVSIATDAASKPTDGGIKPMGVGATEPPLPTHLTPAPF